MSTFNPDEVKHVVFYAGQHPFMFRLDNGLTLQVQAGQSATMYFLNADTPVISSVKNQDKDGSQTSEKKSGWKKFFVASAALVGLALVGGAAYVYFRSSSSSMSEVPKSGSLTRNNPIKSNSTEGIYPRTEPVRP